MAVNGTERTTAQNIKALFSRGTFLQWLRKNMGLGDTLGPLPPENGGTGKTGTGEPVKLTESASGNVVTYTCPDALDNHEVVVMRPLLIFFNYNCYSQCLTVPVNLITNGGSDLSFIVFGDNTVNISRLTVTLRRTSATTFTATFGYGAQVSVTDSVASNSYAA